ncbi:hypothetical protein H5410_030986 [Solanum commersonii]|uniref:Uncharacterized protein n=1 Tax=Solanum commersonii TaxID=4109 RepID=A0A9J5YIY8_SOLCO|nr:hypothetical protein H5410_030986 [Solanum commersonii]
MSTVMELPKSSYEHWKTKSIDGLPPLFSQRVKKILRNEHGEIPYKDYTYGKLIGVCIQEVLFCTRFDSPDAVANSKKKKNRDSRDPNKPYR